MKEATLPGLRLTDLEPTGADFGAEIAEALRRRPRRLPCKFFYDAVGARLFDRICLTEEYYPTRTELAILQEARAPIARFAGPRCRLVELGSGSSLKTRRLLDALLAPAVYVPIDISRQYLLSAAAALAEERPGLEILPVCADYGQPLVLPEATVPVERTVLFFPGSTIGNLEPRDAVAFLRTLRSWCRPGDRLLVGVDLQKSVEVLERAYNDRAGVTAAFNLNLLARANRELGADFDLRQFRHRAVYDDQAHRIEMRLVSQRAQTVSLAGERFHFEPQERLVTEYSHKYTPQGVDELAADAGWSVRHCWTDAQGWFAVFGLVWR